jgi:hypothetical protein
MEEIRARKNYADILDELSGDVVFDMDEVLVDIFPTVFMHFQKNIEKYEPYLVRDGVFDIDTINRRRDHDIRVHLMKGEYHSLPRDQRRLVVEKLRAKKVDREYWKSDMYANLSPTGLGRAVMDGRFISGPRIRSVTILTFSSSEALNEHKRRFVEKYFNHPKIKLVPVMFGTKAKRSTKSDKLKRLKLNWDVFVDDMEYNIRDFAEGFEDIRGKRLISPDFGYNHPSEELLRLIAEKGATYERYIP